MQVLEPNVDTLKNRFSTKISLVILKLISNFAVSLKLAKHFYNLIFQNPRFIIITLRWQTFLLSNFDLRREREFDLSFLGKSKKWSQQHPELCWSPPPGPWFGTSPTRPGFQDLPEPEFRSPRRSPTDCWSASAWWLPPCTSSPTSRTTGRSRNGRHLICSIKK